MPGSVTLTNVTKLYDGVPALEDVSLDVAPGELVALLGSSGCGKTTLLRSVAGLTSLDRGTVRIGERDVTHVPTRRRPIGMLFQHYALFPNMTVAKNVAFPLKVRRLPSERIAERVGELLALVGLEGLGDRYPNQLSGGQQQRVALARALAPEPEVLLLDEPLSALDAVIRSGLRDEIRRIQQRLGITTLYVTHDQSEAMAIADRVAVMERGRIAEIGPPPAIYERPASQYTAVFVGSRNALELPVVDGRVRLGACCDVAAPAGANGQALVVFRPEDVRLSTVPGSGEPGRVDVTVFMGASTRVHVDLSPGQVPVRIFADLPTRDARALRPGTEVWVDLHPDAVLAFPPAA